MGVPSLNDLAVDGTLNTTNQPKLIYDATLFFMANEPTLVYILKLSLTFMMIKYVNHYVLKE